MGVQGFLRHIEQIDGLKGLWQSPQLRPIPSDFVDEMEAYIREAPRALDGDAKKAMPYPLRQMYHVAGDSWPEEIHKRGRDQRGLHHVLQ